MCLPRLRWLTASLVLAACSGGKPSSVGGASPSGGVVDLMKARGLSEADVTAALKTYTPTGKLDEYLTFASGGHSGQVVVVGVPSMRILKYIAVFTPEPWQGYGFDEQTKGLLASDGRGRNLTWADTHHPALSERGGDYDGKFLFIGDKANARVAVIDLADFTTKQIVSTELIGSDHGAAFVTPDTDYVIETTQYATPLGGEYADPRVDYKTKFRGAAVFWKFDRSKGRIDKEASFAIEFPPYTQDLADAGKLVSDGYAFFNSINTELSWGGNAEGNPPMESGSSQNDMDYLHVVDWRKAEALVKGGRAETRNGMRVLSLEVAAAEGVLTFVPEPKSPHGVDVTPDGKDIVVGGKLDTHGTVYSFEKIKALIDRKEYAGKDDFGVPILDFKASIRGQVELGLGPLHTVYDGQGYAYTSMFLETVVAKWSLADLKVVDKVATHYNIGHLTSAEGDTVSPDGKYLIAMNKWALDRFNKVGPLLPQNFQLVDLTTPKMTVLYDLPIGLGEPHYAQMIKADKLTPIDVYPPGEDAVTGEVSPNATAGGAERVERRPDGVHVYMTAIRSHFTPDVIRVKQGETVHVHLTNLEQAYDATHGFAINSYNVNVSIEPGEASDITFVADRAGVFPMYCTEFCSALHLEMAGYLLVEPR